ncbi:MAG: hypothetical protein U0L05_08885 [Schaedlerella sp.]|nr:hypothetical protein [Schaedlerella sp.]
MNIQLSDHFTYRKLLRFTVALGNKWNLDFHRCGRSDGCSDSSGIPDIKTEKIPLLK